jgi:DNA (cytosine-5)-methyltransferase 1
MNSLPQSGLKSSPPKENTVSEGTGCLTGATLCSGIMAPEQAMPWVDWKWCAEIEPFPRLVIAARHPEIPNLGDINALNFITRASHVDVLVAGTPCQSFSVAGLRKSLADSRGNLTLRFVEIVHALRPNITLWENVPGVLSTRDNAFGCFLAGLVGADEAIAPTAGWKSAGVVSGPLGTAAWRILDAQYFGLAQRRARLFLVFCFGDSADPAEILFEFESMRRDSPPCRETGERVTGTISARTEGGGGLGTDFDLGGGSSPTVAMCLNGKGDAGRIDGESETFVAGFQNTGKGWWNDQPVAQTIRDASAGGASHANLVAHSLRADGFDASEDGTGRGTPLVVLPTLEAGAHTGKSTDDPRAGIGIGESGDPMFTLQSRKQHAIAFDTTQITSKANYSNPKPGDPCHPLAAGAHVPAIAFSQKDHGADAANELAPTLRSMGHHQSHANGGGQLAVAFQERGRDGGRNFEHQEDLAYSLNNPGAGGRAHERNVPTPAMAVRRLTPRECERLQGFPDDYTLVHRLRGRKKPKRFEPRTTEFLVDVADGPRYKALGNSMAVPVLAWIGERIRKNLLRTATPVPCETHELTNQKENSL